MSRKGKIERATRRPRPFRTRPLVGTLDRLPAGSRTGTAFKAIRLRCAMKSMALRRLGVSGRNPHQADHFRVVTSRKRQVLPRKRIVTLSASCCEQEAPGGLLWMQPRPKGLGWFVELCSLATGLRSSELHAAGFGPAAWQGDESPERARDPRFGMGLFVTPRGRATRRVCNPGLGNAASPTGDVSFPFCFCKGERPCRRARPNRVVCRLLGGSGLTTLRAVPADKIPALLRPPAQPPSGRRGRPAHPTAADGGLRFAWTRICGSASSALSNKARRRSFRQRRKSFFGAWTN
ncbi:hypothetical protein Bpfe_031101 [Biomphalaria pfeifferi]|uniref:Uncharacterized protein n=1 Tax=Biomphalaria pfeifferi TaxID=112525 RepID=A0AAD8EUR8_BIOPF|nr:hypothetical protein Bpfe_031101 [Biomphalaria pfeifferi]